MIYKFIIDLCNSFGKLLINIVGSRKSLFQIISKIITIHLILTLKNEWYIVLVFIISTIGDFVYFGYLQFENIKTEIEAKI